ncbi:MAG: hypothetical protein C4524_12960, partial [Candidatus Zixiibacteriota bacterium]
MATNEKTIDREEIFLLVKKGQFEALKDGLARLPENHLRRMAAYWLGSQEAMILPLEELHDRMKEAMGDGARLSSVLDRLPKRSFDLLYYILSEGGMLTREELLAGFPLRESETLADLSEPLTNRGLVWELRAAAKDPEGARFCLLGTCAAWLQLPSFLEGKLGSLLPHRGKDQLGALVETLGGDAKQLSRQRETFPWLKSQLRNPVKLRRFYESLDISDRKLLKILALHPQGMTVAQLRHAFSLFTNKEAGEQLQRSLENLDARLGLIQTMAPGTNGDHRSREPLYRLPREVAQIIRQNFKEKYADEFALIPAFRSPDEDFALNTRNKERSALWVDFQQLLNHLVRCEVG